MFLLLLFSILLAYNWESAVFITAPIQLAAYTSDIGGIKASSSKNFGAPKYGGSVHGRIYADFANLDGCRPFTNYQHWERPFIVLVARHSGCNSGIYANPAINAQEIGAEAVIFVNTRNWGNSMDPRTTAPTVTNDTLAKSLLVTVMIGLDPGLRIIQVLNSTNNVKGAITWEHPKPSQTVEMILVQSLQNNRLDSFRRQFMRVQQRFGDELVFNPRYYLHSSHIPSYHNCIRGGLYCNRSPVGSPGVDGSEVVIEHWYELKVWEYAKRISEPSIFWNFVIFFENRCTADCERDNNCHQRLWSDECREEFLNQRQDLKGFLEIEFANEIEDWSNPEPILTLDAELRLKLVLQESTLLSVNGQAYRGSMECEFNTNVCDSNCPPLEFVCSAFTAERRPEICGSGTDGCICSDRDIGGICGGNGKIDEECGTYYTGSYDRCSSCSSQMSCVSPLIVDENTCACVADPDNCIAPFEEVNGVCFPSDCIFPLKETDMGCQFPTPKLQLESVVPEVTSVTCPDPLWVIQDEDNSYQCGLPSYRAYLCPDIFTLRLGNCVLPPAIDGNCPAPFVPLTSPATAFSSTELKLDSHQLTELTTCTDPAINEVSANSSGEESKAERDLIIVIIVATVLFALLIVFVFLYVHKSLNFELLRLKYAEIEEQEDVELTNAPDDAIYMQGTSPQSTNV